MNRKSEGVATVVVPKVNLCALPIPDSFTPRHPFNTKVLSSRSHSKQTTPRTPTTRGIVGRKIKQV